MCDQMKEVLLVGDGLHVLLVGDGVMCDQMLLVGDGLHWGIELHAES